jgi:iron uptake system EfeUOB component EfeO/EfeM
MVSDIPSLARRGLVLLGVTTVTGLLALIALSALGVGAGRSTTSASTAARFSTPRISAAARRYSQEDSIHQGDVSGGAPPNAEHNPLKASAFAAPIARYRAYAARQLNALGPQVSHLEQALRTGDRARARGDWLTAYARYLRLGAVYGPFGSLNQAIDGTPGGLPGGTRDPRFGGLHRLELGLWTGAGLGALVPVAKRLHLDVARLRRRLPKVQITSLEYATRAHEILEDAQRDFLSGADVPWSGAGVLATAAALAATQEVISTLRLPLQRRDGLGPVEYYLDRLQALMTALRRAQGGHWPTLDELGQGHTEQLDGVLGGALEALSGVPGDLETQVTPPVPTLPSVTSR